jgi:hypothetical protein
MTMFKKNEWIAGCTATVFVCLVAVFVFPMAIWRTWEGMAMALIQVFLAFSGATISLRLKEAAQIKAGKTPSLTLPRWVYVIQFLSVLLAALLAWVFYMQAQTI